MIASNNIQPEARVEFTAAIGITPRPIDWIWDQYLAAGKLHVIGGDPGTGKTNIAISMAATISTGGTWPDGTRAPQGDVVIWSGEDDRRDVLTPRLLANGADQSRIHYPDTLVPGAGTRTRTFDPATDLAQLRIKIRQHANVKLLILDPLVSAISGYANSNTTVRNALEEIGALAEEAGCAVLGIMHFKKASAGKDLLERFAGAGAFGQVPRIALACLKQTTETGPITAFTRAKSNLGPSDGGFFYKIESLPISGHAGVTGTRVVWGDPLHGDAETEGSGPPDLQVPAGMRSDVMTWLRNRLLGHPGGVDKRELCTAAAEVGFSYASLYRAAKSMSVTFRQTGFGAGKRSLWSMTATEVTVQTTVTTGAGSTFDDARVVAEVPAGAAVVTPENIDTNDPIEVNAEQVIIGADNDCYTITDWMDDIA